jgi:dihydropteroate synthase
MERVGVDPVGISLMAPKQFHYNLKLLGLTPAQANIIKQDLLSVGGEAAVAKGVVACSVDSTDAILSATEKQFTRLIDKLKCQRHVLKEIAGVLQATLDNISSASLVLKGCSGSWELGRRTMIMGVLNVTPDSFSDGGMYMDSGEAVARGLEMVEEGADIVDVGGESSRPGAGSVSELEESGRVIPVVEALAAKGVSVSVDTTKASVAERALDSGAAMVNDISALLSDPSMAGVVLRYKAPVVLMHMRGTPQTMQDDVVYDDLMAEVFGFLSERLSFAVGEGIEPERIVIDPGIGFGKSAGGSLEILRRLGELKGLGRPVLVGASRKSFIGSVLGGGGDGGDGGDAAGGRLTGTLSSVVAAILGGAHMVRVHDVKESTEAARMADAIRNSGVEEVPG